MNPIQRYVFYTWKKTGYRHQLTELVDVFPITRLFQSRYFSCCARLHCRQAVLKSEETESMYFVDNPALPDIDVDRVTNGNPVLIERLKLIQLEVEFLRQSGLKVPLSINSHQWIKLLSMDTPRDRSACLYEMWRKNIKKEHKKLKQFEDYSLDELKKIYAEKGGLKSTTSCPVLYNLFCNSLFTRLRETYMDKYYNYKLVQAMRFSPAILVDCQYEPSMAPKSLIKYCRQLLEMFAKNRLHSNPHHLIFCNMNPSGKLIKKLRAMNPSLDKPEYPFVHTSQSYLDLFPREKLVYLMPNAPTILRNYDANDVYILGGLPYNFNEMKTYAAAKKHNLRTAKLPLDLHLNWGVASKNLDLSHVISIMNDVKDTGNWKFAFRDVCTGTLSSVQNHKNLSEEPLQNSHTTARKHDTYRTLLREISKMNNGGNMSESKKVDHS